jgi:hypothetical protein
MAIMKRAALSLLLTFAFVSPTFAILRPRYPVKPTPPYRGQFIIGEYVLKSPVKRAPSPAPR